MPLRRPALGVADAAAWLLERGPAVVAVSDGPNGLLVRTAAAARFSGAGSVGAALPESWYGRLVVVPASPGPVVQTTGAGDAATAALLAGIHSMAPLDRALELVRAAAAHRVAGLGSLAPLRSSTIRWKER